MNKQHELIIIANRQALKNIKYTAKKTVLHVGGSTFNIPKDNLVLLSDHPQGRHKIQDNYKFELFIVVSKKWALMSTQFFKCGGSGAYGQMMTIV